MHSAEQGTAAMHAKWQGSPACTLPNRGGAGVHVKRQGGAGMRATEQGRAGTRAKWQGEAGMRATAQRGGRRCTCTFLVPRYPYVFHAFIAYLEILCFVSTAVPAARPVLFRHACRTPRPLEPIYHLQRA